MASIVYIKTLLTKNMYLIFVYCMCICISGAFGIRCYQCSTDMEPPGQDYCGAFQGFNTSAYSPVECYSFQAVTPGDFCMKIIQESPGLWGYWKTVHRRCASLSESGTQWGCDWWWDENGVQTEVCYCNQDGCNGAPPTLTSTLTPAQRLAYKVIAVTAALLTLPLLHLGLL